MCQHLYSSNGMTQVARLEGNRSCVSAEPCFVRPSSPPVTTSQSIVCLYTPIRTNRKLVKYIEGGDLGSTRKGENLKRGSESERERGNLPLSLSQVARSLAPCLADYILPLFICHHDVVVSLCEMTPSRELCCCTIVLHTIFFMNNYLTGPPTLDICYLL